MEMIPDFVTEDEEDEKEFFHSEGPHVGMWITRSVLDERGLVSSLSIGKIVGYLGPNESDFTDDNGEACGLWKVEYDCGELEGDAEDLEEWELFASGMRETREKTEAAALEAAKQGTASSPVYSSKKKTRYKSRKGEGGDRFLLNQKNKEEEEENNRITLREESEYERQRRERIEANEAFLRELGLSSKKERDKIVTQAKRKRSTPIILTPQQQEELRRSSRRCVVETHREKSRYNEDRAYKEACEAAERDARQELERRREFRLQKEAERRREIQARKNDEQMRREEKRREDAFQTEMSMLRRRVISLEREITKKTTPDRQAARSLEKPDWLKAAGFDWRQWHPAGIGTFAFEQHTLVNDIQVGDQFFYFVDGHLDYLKHRGLTPDPSDTEINAELVPDFLSQAPAEYRVLRVVVTQALPCYPEFGEYVDARLYALQKAHPSIFAWFQFPVDLEEYPEYTRLIKRPMDFSTVQATRYESMDAFRNDLMLIFSNALQFNLKESDIAEAAITLRTTFLKQDEWPLDAFFTSSAYSNGNSNQHRENSSVSKKSKKKHRLHTHDSNEMNIPPPQIQQRLLVRLVPSFYLEKTHYDDPDQDNDGEAANNNLQFLRYHTRKANKGYVVLEPWTVWITDDVDFLVPVDLIDRKLNELAEKPAFALGYDGTRFAVKSAQAVHPKLQPSIPRWRGLELRQLDATESIWKNVWEVQRFGEVEVLEYQDPHSPNERRASSRLRKLQIEAEDTTATQKKKKNENSHAWTLYPTKDTTADKKNKNELSFGDFTTENIHEASDTLVRVIDAIAEVSDLADPLFRADENPDAERRRPKENDTTEDANEADSSEKAAEKSVPQLQAPVKLSLGTIRTKLRDRVYRRPSAVYDDVRRIYLFTAATCYYPWDTQKKASMANEKLTFKAKLAAQLCVALFANELAEETAKKVAFTPVSPWQTFVRHNQGLKNKAGIMIRENCKLALTAARRDLSHDIVHVRAVIAELRHALLVVRTNAAGACRDKSLATLDIHGGWHLGADATRAQDTITFVREGPKIVANLVTNPNQVISAANEHTAYNMRSVSAFAPEQTVLRRLPNIAVGDHLIKRSAPGSPDYVFGTVESINFQIPRKCTVRFPDADPVIMGLRLAAEIRVHYITPPPAVHARLFANTAEPLQEQTLGDTDMLTQDDVNDSTKRTSRKKRRNPIDAADITPTAPAQNPLNTKLLSLRLSTTRILCAKDATDFHDIVNAFDVGTKVAPVTKGGGGHQAPVTATRSSSKRRRR